MSKAKIIGLIMLIVGVVVLAWTRWTQGPVFGYRGHPAVIAQVSGAVELRYPDTRPERARAGRYLRLGGTLLCPRYATAQLDTQAGRLKLFDSSTLSSERRGGRFEWSLVRGRLELNVDGRQGLRLRAAASGTYIELMAGHYAFIADGKGMLTGQVESGTALVYEDDQRPTEVGAGKFFILTPLTPAFVTKKLPAVELDLQITPRRRPGELSTLSGRISPGVRVYVNGEPSFAESSGDFAAALAPGVESAVVVVESLGGQTLRRVFHVQR